MRIVRHLALAAVTALAACGNDSTGTSNVATFVVHVGAEEFAVRVVDQATFAKLDARMQSGNPGVIMGRVVAGDGGFNAPWSWHLEPSSIDAPQASIELCDGTPSYLEAHRDEWIASVHDYCPWTAKVVSVR